MRHHVLAILDGIVWLPWRRVLVRREEMVPHLGNLMPFVKEPSQAPSGFVEGGVNNRIAPVQSVP